jgi:type II secretory pathway predicted ATPase ExeA
MTGPEIPTIAKYNREAVDQIIRSVEGRTYCAVLGPRLSGKTVLLRYIARTVAESLGWTCIYIDLYEMEASTLQGFFAALIRTIAHHLPEMTGQALAVPEASLVSSAVFRGFLSDSVTQLGRDLILIIEHLEAVPTDLVQALLTSLRAAYMDQQTLDDRLVVVVSGALSLATLAVGESSPFRGIAERVFVGDLSEADSEALITELFATDRIAFSGRAIQRLVRATRGDPYLIRRVCRQCVQVALDRAAQSLRGKDVKRITREFLQRNVLEYAPLQEAVRLIEEDPDLLHCILLLLSHGTTPRAEMPLPLSPDVDPLFLTGVVERVDGDRYRIQNLIYQGFLAQHFHPGRVGHLLSMAGRWDAALDYLEAGIEEGNEQARSDLLPATISSMYAADDVIQATRFLTRGLSAAFGAVEARVWYSPPQETGLRLVGHLAWKRGPTVRPAPCGGLKAPVMSGGRFRC